MIDGFINSSSRYNCKVTEKVDDLYKATFVVAACGKGGFSEWDKQLAVNNIIN
jgi:hypothetical protein